MNTDKIRKGTLILMILFIFLFPQLIYAQEVTLRIDFPAEVIEVGDLLIIAVTFESGDQMGTINAELSYNDSQLEYRYGGGNVAQLSNGTGSIYDTLPTGATRRSYEFTFRALESGAGDFNVDFSEIIAYEAGHLLGEPTSSITVTISEDSSPETPEEDPEDSGEEEPEEEPEENSEGIILNTFGNYRLYSVYQQISGYEMTVMQTGEKSVAAFQSENLPENVYLVYAARGEKAPVPYFYDEQENTLQRARVEIAEVEREIEVSMEEDTENQLLSRPIILLIVIALLLVIALVILEQVLGNTKSNQQRGDQNE